MLILSRVCAEFHDRSGAVLHRIVPADLGLFREAPDSIRQDPLFQLLVDDGSIKYPEDTAKQKALEQDPMKGAYADGREIKVKPAKAEAKAETKPVAGDAVKK